MADLGAFVPDTYYKAAVYVGVAVIAGGAVAQSLAFGVVGLGVAFAGLGEWMHMRSAEFPVPGGSYHQTARIRYLPGAIVLWLGVGVVILGIAGLARQLLFS